MTAPVLEPTESNVDRAAEAIHEGSVVVAPSDTNLALTLDPWNPEAVRRAYEIKDRPAHKPLTLFVRDPDDWRLYGTHGDPDFVDALAETFWPGPLNLVLPSTDRVDDGRLQREGTVAIGCLANSTWRALADRVDGPLAMTSANRSGTVDDDRLVDVALAREHVGEGVDLILDGGARGTTRASTILDLTGDPEILRRGDVTADDLRDVLGPEAF
ncbi:MAG: L-threonylcarbamoyladenylate synthase [Halosimplex sp.]